MTAPCYVLAALVVVPLGVPACTPADDGAEDRASAPRLDMQPCRFESYDRMLAALQDEPPREGMPPDPAAGDALCGRLEGRRQLSIVAALEPAIEARLDRGASRLELGLYGSGLFA